ncbi:sigma factor-like helix-turn-helix DNA-binding protein [Streptomyces pacificus]|uniref:HTH cro/C1-type domain-containing protein n=1 Tax=Streptomyces pacificus TaxID=2705029 RepID=A0A6A0AT36_9ACTN|nr:sigma factor-like helix-turn-helix DNA-binding protein [Streptomyces pacificus]GFH36076.1 hypothetical protein SCWH03_22980 [Streptomyces pacificus]
MTKSTADSTEAAVPPLPSPRERRRLREARALSEAQLAEVLGVTEATVRAWETGRGGPRGRKRRAYAKLLATYRAELSSREPTAEDHGGVPAHRPGHTDGGEPADRTADGAGRADRAARADERTGRTARAAGKPTGTPASPPEGGPGAARPAGRADRAGRAGRAGKAATGTPTATTDTVETATAETATAETDTTPAPPAESPAGKPPAHGPGADPATAGGPAERSAEVAPAGYRKAVAHRPGDPVPAGPGEAPRPYPGTALARAADEQHASRRPEPQTERGDRVEPRQEAPREDQRGNHGGDLREDMREDMRGDRREESAHPRRADQERREAAGRPSQTSETARTAQPPGTPCPTRPSHTTRPSESSRPPARDEDGAALSAEQAFDELYARTAPGLARQTLLLTGREALAREAVEQAFQLAWERWPEVAVDRDPGGWARAAAYEYAMSPWHRLRRAHRHPDPVASARPATVAYPGGRTLREALLGLPPAYRRTLLLYDGLGLDLPETAAETEASTPAAANRLLNARAAVAEQIPELAEPGALQHELSDLVENLAAPGLSPAPSVRGGSERRAELWTRAAIGLTVLILAAAAVTMAVTEGHYEPPQAPGEQVGGVPPKYGPEPYSKEDHRLRVQLRSHPAAGPARLVPSAR